MMAQPAASGPPGRQRILIVEDDPTTADLLRDLLEFEGYDIEHAADGAAALAGVAAGALDLVLLDLTLPDIDGLELCRQARVSAPADDAYLPMLMVTAQARAADRRAGFAAGADDYISKPFDPEELLARVQVWLRVRSQSKAKWEAERRAASARLEGVTLAAREIADLLGNDIQAPTAAIDLLQREPGLPARARVLVDMAAESLAEAAQHLSQLQNVVRVATKETPIGTALDLERSVQPDETAPAARDAPTLPG
jgi:DNA-binding response OmpR family regulator